MNRHRTTSTLARLTAAAVITAGAACLATTGGPASSAPAPDAASARGTGWVLPAVASVHGDEVNTSYGVHCGSSRFGVYHLTGGLTDHGVQSAWTFDLAVTEDGKLHKARNVRFADYTPAKVRKQVTRIFAKTRYHYLNSGQELIQGLFADGTQQATQPFNPHQGRC